MFRMRMLFFLHSEMFFMKYLKVATTPLVFFIFKNQTLVIQICNYCLQNFWPTFTFFLNFILQKFRFRDYQIFQYFQVQYIFCNRCSNSFPVDWCVALIFLGGKRKFVQFVNPYKLLIQNSQNTKQPDSLCLLFSQDILMKQKY